MPRKGPAARRELLPDPVYRDFVDMLFEMRVPIAGMGLLFVAVAGLLATYKPRIALHPILARHLAAAIA